MKLKQLHLKDLLFFFAIIVLALVSFLIVKPFLGIIVISLVLVELLNPVYYFLEKKLKRPVIAALLSTVVVFLIIIIPLVLIGLIATNQAISAKDDLSNYIQENRLLENNGQEITNQINNSLNQLGLDINIDSIDYSQIFDRLSGELTTTASSFISLLKNFISLAFQTIFLFYTVFYIFKEHGNLRKTFNDFSPLAKELNDIFIERFTSITKSIIKGNFLIGLVVGIAGGLIFWVLGIGAPLFWGLIIAMLAIIPLGGGIVWVPFSILLVLTGNTPKGIILFLYGTFFMGSLDDILRPLLLEKDAKVHPLILFFSIIGGIELFGVFGLIYGPLIVALFLSLYDVYRHKYKNL